MPQGTCRGLKVHSLLGRGAIFSLFSLDYHIVTRVQLGKISSYFPSDPGYLAREYWVHRSLRQALNISQRMMDYRSHWHTWHFWKYRYSFPLSNHGMLCIGHTVQVPDNVRISSLLIGCCRILTQGSDVQEESIHHISLHCTSRDWRSFHVQSLRSYFL